MSTRLYRLAEIFAPKYGFVAIAANEPTDPNVVKDIKYQILNAFNLYVNDGNPIKNPYSMISSGTASVNKDRIIPTLVTLRDPEPHSKYILTTMKKLVEGNNLEAATPEILFVIINRLLERMKPEKMDEILNFVRDNASKNDWREDLLTKVKTTFKRLSSSLDQIYKKIGTLVPKKAIEESRAYEPAVAEIKFKKLYEFILTPIAQTLGITDVKVLALVLEKNRALLTNVINSVNRGHMPKRGDELWNAVMKVVDLYNQLNKFNVTELESTPPAIPNQPSLFDPGTGPEAKAPLTVSRRLTPEQEAEQALFEKQQKAKQEGGGAGEGSI